MLRNKDFKYRYSTGRKDLPIDFCELALSSSIRLDIGLGYFSVKSTQKSENRAFCKHKKPL